MEPIFDITPENYIRFFNRISKILYVESTGDQKHMIRDILGKIVDRDRTISKRFFKTDIFYDNNFVSKYCFYDQDDNGKTNKEYRIFIVKDIPGINKDNLEFNGIYIKTSATRGFMKDSMYIISIFIHYDMFTDNIDPIDKYNSLKYLFSTCLDYENNYCHFSIDRKMALYIRKYKDIVGDILSGLLIDIDIKNKNRSDIISEILSQDNSYLVTGSQEIRIALNKVDEIFFMFSQILNEELQTSTEQG